MGESLQGCLGVGNTAIYICTNNATLAYGAEYLLCPPTKNDSSEANDTRTSIRHDTGVVPAGSVVTYKISPSSDFNYPIITTIINGTNVTTSNMHLNMATTIHYVIDGKLSFYTEDGITNILEFEEEFSCKDKTWTMDSGPNKSMYVYFFALGDDACAGFTVHIHSNEPEMTNLPPYSDSTLTLISSGSGQESNESEESSEEDLSIISLVSVMLGVVIGFLIALTIYLGIIICKK